MTYDMKYHLNMWKLQPSSTAYHKERCRSTKYVMFSLASSRQFIAHILRHSASTAFPLLDPALFFLFLSFSSLYRLVFFPQFDSGSMDKASHSHESAARGKV